jgi:mannose/cellobiose epimerase-like protein (N-acyl-D-glucosamine 2-epimerase family)
MHEVVAFYYLKCINKEDGGYFNFFFNDGLVTVRSTRYIVSTTRFIFNLSLAAVHSPMDNAATA